MFNELKREIIVPDVDICGIVDHYWLEIIVPGVDICGIVDHYYGNSLFIFSYGKFSKCLKEI